MALTSGTKFGPYEIVALLGTGGMGEVYRARDTKLHRDVALKIVPAVVTHDATSMMRFEREAQLLASLNHPHIASLYGLEESGAVPALVMELVEGPTLADRILAGPLPVEEALRIAGQMAEGLESAHERGIIHRDLKPANIKLTRDGEVKILDFGLAKAFREDPLVDPMSSPTLSSPATITGAIMGTAAYMSPEQARGKPLSRRTDVWSFGCVLYELLTARRAFLGDTVSDTVAAVLTRDPDWKILPHGIPAGVRRLLRRCLEKDVKLRLRDMGDARIEIEDAIGELDQPEAEADSPVAAGARRAVLPYVLLTAVLALVFTLGFWLRSRNVSAPTKWSGSALGGPGIGFGVRVSPDGRTLALLAMVDGLTQVAIMNPDSGNWTVLTHDRSKGAADSIVWSRDSSKIYFARLNPQPVGVFSVPALGGDERLVVENASAPEVLPDGSFLVLSATNSDKSQLCHYWPESGRMQPLGAELWNWGPSESVARVFSDGAEAVFVGNVLNATDREPHVYALEVNTGHIRQLAPELKLDSTTLASNVVATSLDGQSALIDMKAADMHSIVAIPRHGSTAPKPLIPFTAPMWSADVSADGSLFVDQVDRPLEFLRLRISGGAPERWGTQRNPETLSSPLQFADARILLPSVISGRNRLVTATPGKDFVPFVDTEDETAPPMTSAGEKAVAFLIGTGADRTIAVASVAEGRIIRRLSGTKGALIQSLSASADGAMLYYTAAESVWKIPANDGKPEKLGAGDFVAFDPCNSNLVVAQGGQLFRMAATGGAEQPIRLEGDLRIAPTQLASNAVGPDGRIALSVVAKDYWFYQAAVLDPTTGRIKKIPLDYWGDIIPPGWDTGGHVLANGYPLKSVVWRFRQGR